MTGAPTLCTTSDIWLDFKAQFAFTLGITKSYNVPTIEDTIMMCKRCTRDTHTPNLVPTGWILRQILCKQYVTCQRDVGDVSGSTSGCHKTRWLDLQAGDALHHLKSSSRRLDLNAYSHSDLLVMLLCHQSKSLWSLAVWLHFHPARSSIQHFQSSKQLLDKPVK